MSVTVHYACGGCNAKAEGTDYLRVEWVSAFGGPLIGSLQPANSPRSVAPEGWVPFDPYTGCCYCPKCWAEIEAPKEDAATRQKGGA